MNYSKNTFFIYLAKISIIMTLKVVTMTMTLTIFVKKKNKKVEEEEEEEGEFKNTSNNVEIPFTNILNDIIMLKGYYLFVWELPHFRACVD